MNGSQPSAAALTTTLGTVLVGKTQATFLVWAPFAKNVEVHILGTKEAFYPLTNVNAGYFCTTVDGVGPGTQYRYLLNGEHDFSDPASRLQPNGCRGHPRSWTPSS